MTATSLPQSQKHLDSSALDGLRGIASLHVMVYHYMLMSGKAYICGSLEMSLFYLLSGFGLAIGYGKTVWAGWSFLGGKSQDGEGLCFGALKFYRNRFARIGPLFYLANTFVCWSKYPSGVTIWRTILTITMTNAWFINHGDGTRWGPYDFEAWTVTTLTFFYMVFPVILPFLQSLTTGQLITMTVWLHHLQAWPTYLFLNMSGERMGSGLHPLTWIATAHPLTRLPVFLMGVAAGLARLRGEDDFNLGRNLLHCLLPWGLDRHLPGKSSEEGKEKAWRWRVDLGVVALFSYVLFCKTLTAIEKQEKVCMVIPIERMGLVYVQLMVMVGLTADGGRSLAGRIFRLRAVRFLGRISMALYLFHVPVLTFLTSKSNIMGWSKKDPFVLILCALITFTLATLSTLFMEEPLKNVLQAKRK